MSKKQQTSDSGVPVCLVCSKKKRLTRGLCDTHYAQFMRQREILEDDDKAVFEEQCIADGMLLEIKPSGRKGYENPFRKLAEDYELRQKLDYQLENADNELAKAVSKHKKQQTPNRNSKQHGG